MNGVADPRPLLADKAPGDDYRGGTATGKVIVPLEVVTPRESLSAMCPASPGVPALRGCDPSGSDYISGACSAETGMD